MARYKDLPEDMDASKGEELQKRYKKELSRLRKQYKASDAKTAAAIETILQDIARQAAMMSVLWDDILEHGTEVEYKNGENQYGTKQSPSFQSYQQCSQKHTAAMKVLQSFMPKQERAAPEKDDGFEEFIGGRKD